MYWYDTRVPSPIKHKQFPESTKYSICRSKVWKRADYKVDRAADNISIPPSGHSVVVLAYTFVHEKVEY